MIHVDTHVILWVAQGQHERLSEFGRTVLDSAPAIHSPVVRLELKLLFEIGRLRVEPDTLLADLSAQIGLRESPIDTSRLVSYAAPLTWTRDPFDRLIAANALADDLPLLTKDRRMLTDLSVAVWDGPPSG